MKTVWAIPCIDCKRPVQVAHRFVITKGMRCAWCKQKHIEMLLKSRAGHLRRRPSLDDS
jgi:hypothetical protein